MSRTKHRTVRVVHFARIVAAFLVFLALALGLYAWLLSRRMPPPPAQPVAEAMKTQVESAPAMKTYPVVVTTRRIPAGQPIAADGLRVVQLPIDPAGAFATVDVLVGRVPTTDLSEATPLNENQLASGLAQRLDAGERAVAVRADEVMGVGNRVQPGDFVDVFVVLKPDGRDIDRNQSRLLLSRTRVLAFGSASIENQPSKGNDGGSATPHPSGSRTEGARTAVLAVSVSDIPRLALGESGGQLILALRHPGDLAQPDSALFAGLTTTQTQPATRRAETPVAVADSARRAQVPAPRARRDNEVEFIRGNRREMLTY